MTLRLHQFQEDETTEWKSLDSNPDHGAQRPGPLLSLTQISAPPEKRMVRSKHTLSTDVVLTFPINDLCRPGPALTSVLMPRPQEPGPSDSPLV